MTNIQLNTSHYFHSCRCIVLLYFPVGGSECVRVQCALGGECCWEEADLLDLTLLSAFCWLPGSAALSVHADCLSSLFFWCFSCSLTFLSGLSFLHDCRGSDSNTLSRSVARKEGCQDTIVIMEKTDLIPFIALIEHVRSKVNFVLETRNHLQVHQEPSKHTHIKFEASCTLGTQEPFQPKPES